MHLPDLSNVRWRNYATFAAIVGGTALACATGVGVPYTIALGIAGIFGNIAAGDAAKKWDEKRRDPKYAHPNHDLTLLVANAIASVFHACAKDPKHQQHKAWFDALGDITPSLSLDIAQHPALDSLASQNLSDIFKESARKAGKHEFPGVNWAPLVQYIQLKAGKSENPAAVSAADMALRVGLFAEIREMFKRDFAGEGRAYAALCLDVNAQLLAQLAEVARDQKKTLVKLIVQGNDLKEIKKQLQATLNRHCSALSPEQSTGLSTLVNGFPNLIKTVDDVLFEVGLIGQDVRVIKERQVEQATKEGLHDVKNDTAYIRREMDDLRRHGRPRTSIPTNLPDPSPRFDAREEDLKALHANLKSCGTLALGQQVALWADGGVGKTMLAEHYGWIYLNDYPGGVFKIGADVAQLRIPLADLAPMLHVAVNHSGTTTPRSPDEVAADVKESLEGHGPALLILDNVPEDQRWFDHAYHQFLPGGACKRIITTRRDALGEVEMQKVGTFTPAQGRAILARFRKDAAEEPNQKDVEWIVDWFGGLGAGLLVVGAYMTLTMNKTLTWPAYRKSLEKSGQVAALKTDQQAVDKASIRAIYQHRFDAAFDTTLSAMEKAEPETIALLEYAALLPEDMAPRPWLEDLLKRDPRGNVKVLPGHEENPSEPVFARLLAREWLRPVDTQGRILALHRVLRRRLREKIDQRPRDRQTMLETVADHAARRGAWLSKPGPDHLVPWINAVYRWELAPLKALVDPPRMLDFDHADVGACIAGAASVLYALGRAGEAEPLYRDALAMNQRLFKGDHRDVVRRLDNLASVLDALGRAEDAKPLFRDALAMRQRLFKSDHPDVANRLNNLTGVPNVLGRAEPPLRDTLAMYQQLFKGDHPDVAQCLNNLAALLNSLGRAGETEPLYRDALTMYQRLFKGDHPDVATSLNNLATVLETLGRAKEAEPLYRDALAMRQRLFPGDHPDTVQSLNNLAALLFKQGKREAAIPLIDDAAAMILRVFGPDHPSSRNILSWQKTIHGVGWHGQA